MSKYLGRSGNWDEVALVGGEDSVYSGGNAESL